MPDPTTFTLTPGKGYWDVTHDPWGAVFGRATEPITLSDIEAIDCYPDGSPRRVIGTAADGRRLACTIHLFDTARS
jgi:hypothetical protein